MSKNMSSKGALYEPASTQFNNAINNYTGNTGYTNSIQQGKVGADMASQAAQAQAQTAARNSGMSKAQAAARGAANASNAYINNLATQQGNAYNAGKDNVGSNYNNLQTAQTENQNRYDRAMSNAGLITNGIANVAKTGIDAVKLFSDERLKNYEEISKKICYMAPSKKKSLIWKNPEEE